MQSLISSSRLILLVQLFLLQLNIVAMDFDDVLENENYFEAGPRGEVVVDPPFCRKKVDEKDIEELLQIGYYNSRSLNDNHSELAISNTSCKQWKSMPDRPHGANAKNNEMLRRGFQSSQERKSRKKLRDEKKNVEQAFSDEAFLSFKVDPLPQLFANKPTDFPQSSETAKSIEFLELSFRDLPEESIKLRSSHSGSSLSVDCLDDNVMEFGLHSRKGLVDERNSDRDLMFRRETDGNILSKRDDMHNFPKSLLEREIFKGSPKSLISPFKKMLDPIMKSKSLRNPSHMETKAATCPPIIKRHRVFRKSLLKDFSRTLEKKDYQDGSTEREELSKMASSPSHLHALINLDSNHGSLSYEFAIKDREDVIFAKTWRTNSAFNWVYTFHNSKNKGIYRSAKSSPIIGQMQVSCYLCPEVSDIGSLEISTVTEFVLYDIAQARRSCNIEEGSLRSNCAISKSQRHPSFDFDSDPSVSYPWAPGDLHTHLEIASIVIQVPSNKKQTKELRVEEDTGLECMSNADVMAVISSGPHGLASNEESRPSSLLDRWTFGGGCDCGGWDMNCPITVLDRLSANDVGDCSAKRCVQQMTLFVQGRKEMTPSLSMIVSGKEQYSIDFHAQLSSLQAFSICIAILHSSEAASALCCHDNKQRLYSNSLKLILEEEVKHLLEAVAEEEKKKAKNKIEQLPPPFILDSPFSPMGRV